MVDSIFMPTKLGLPLVVFIWYKSDALSPLWHNTGWTPGRCSKILTDCFVSNLWLHNAEKWIWKRLKVCKNLLSGTKLTFLPLTRIQVGHFYHYQILSLVIHSSDLSRGEGISTLCATLWSKNMSEQMVLWTFFMFEFKRRLCVQKWNHSSQARFNPMCSRERMW